MRRDLVASGRGKGVGSLWAVRRALVVTIALVIVLGVEVHADTIIRHGPLERPWVALTFDDGWSVQRCARIVRTLRAKRAPATFFVNGAIVKRDPGRWRRLLEGFPVANHSLSHMDLTRLDAGRIRGQIATNERVIEQALGDPSCACCGRLTAPMTRGRTHRRGARLSHHPLGYRQRGRPLRGHDPQHHSERTKWT